MKRLIYVFVCLFISSAGRADEASFANCQTAIAPVAEASGAAAQQGNAVSKAAATKTSTVVGSVGAFTCSKADVTANGCSGALNTAKPLIADCEQAVSRANMMCIGLPQYSQIAVLMGGMTAFMGLMSSAQAQQQTTTGICQKASNMMNDISGLLAAVNISCGTGMVLANKACGNAQASMANALKLCTEANIKAEGCVLGTPEQGVAKAQGVTLVKAIGQTNGELINCQKATSDWKFPLLVGAAGAVEFLRAASQSQACTTAVASAAAATSPLQTTPPAALSNSSTGILGSTATPATAASAPPAGMNAPPPITGGGGGGGVNAGGGAAPGGGGGGGTSPGGGGSPGKQAAGEKSVNDLYAGGLGGGSSNAHGGGGYADAASGGGGAYSKYMPTKAAASDRSPAATSDISGSSGKDNFQKVNQRMFEIRNTLLTN